MIDPNAEIERMRQRLRFKNLSEAVIDEICDEVSRDISMRTADILADAMSEAVNIGEEMRSDEFINEIRAVRSGSTFDIITDSGRTDYSEPPFPMLPKLLKNAKVSKDGSLYKVIPIKQKGLSQKKSMVSSTESALQSISDARRRAKEEKSTTERGSISPSAFQGMDTIAAMQSISGARQKSTQVREKSTEPAVAFRTASSKQDASVKWVNPGRTVDVSGALNNINERLHEEIDRTVEEVIRMYEGMY